MISSYIIPILIMLILFNGIRKKQNIYDDFLTGVINGLKTMLNIIPSILAMIIAINIFINSGILNTVSNLIQNIFFMKIPMEIITMAILRPISGSATLAVLTNIFSLYGPDSFTGMLASTIQGCTDTTIYVLALYFGSIRINKTKYALGVGLFADLMGIIASVIIVSIFFG